MIERKNIVLFITCNLMQYTAKYYPMVSQMGFKGKNVGIDLLLESLFRFYLSRKMSTHSTFNNSLAEFLVSP